MERKRIPSRIKGTINWRCIFFPFLLCLAGCGLFGTGEYIPLIPEGEEIPQIHHPMDLTWDGKEDFYFRRFSLFMPEEEKKRYLKTDPSKRWEEFHKRFLLFQELETFLGEEKKKLSSSELELYYHSKNSEEARLFLIQKGLWKESNSHKGE